MSPKKGDRAAPPAEPGFWVIKFGTNDAAKGWEELEQQAKGNLWTAWDTIRKNPCPRPATERHHPLKGALATSPEGQPQWQYEVTAAGRIWYVVDEAKMVVWILHAGTAHPRATDKKNRRLTALCPVHPGDPRQAISAPRRPSASAGTAPSTEDRSASTTPSAALFQLPHQADHLLRPEQGMPTASTRRGSARPVRHQHDHLRELRVTPRHL